MTMIDSRQLVALAGAGAVKAVAVKGTAGGFVIAVDSATVMKRGDSPRIFRKLQTAAVFLRRHGIQSFSVDLTHWSPDKEAAL